MDDIRFKEEHFCDDCANLKKNFVDYTLKCRKGHWGGLDTARLAPKGKRSMGFSRPLKCVDDYADNITL